MNSCLYQGRVMHARLAPIKNRFVYPLFMFYLDLDEVAETARRYRWIGYNRFNIFSFFDKDHLAEGLGTVREKVWRILADHDVADRVKTVRLLTHLRTLGHVFNPVSFYFAFDAEEKPVCAIVEVENTYHEKKNYYLAPHTLSEGRFRLQAPKYFYVSPFIALDAIFDFNLEAPRNDLQLFIDDYQDGRKFFMSSLAGRRQALTDARLAWYALRFPFMTLQVLGLIHWQAFKLWLRKLPHVRKTEFPDLQREVTHVKNPG